MKYISRVFALQLFTWRIERILDNSDLSSNYFSRNYLYNKIKRDYFSRENPLDDLENKITFPKATLVFKKALKEGKHDLESAESNLDFLKKEFDDYFEDLLERKTLKANEDRPLEYYLNHTSPMIHWEIGIIKLVSFFGRILENLLKIVNFPAGNK